MRMEYQAIVMCIELLILLGTRSYYEHTISSFCTIDDKFPP